MQISSTTLSADVELDGVLADVVFLGIFVKYIVALPGGQRVTVYSSDSALRSSVSLNAKVKIGWKLAHQHIVEG